MTPSKRLIWRLVPFVLALGLGACASIESAVDTRRQVTEEAQSVRQGPAQVPYKSITGFSEALRCMDNHLLDYGVRDVSVIVEDIVDETKKVNAGTKDMLISALSDMTRRSRAIKPIAYGKDSGNTIGFLFQAQQRDQFAIVPPFGIRGSITQFDDAIVRKNIDGGISIEPFINIGAAKTAAASVIGLDLSMLSTSDLSIVSGVSSRNSVIFLREGKGLESEAAIKKFGINFSVSVARSEGQSQALRTLVELASIELVGRLARVPYWSCLGATDQDVAVQTEIRDWYDAMLANPFELFEYFQRQMRMRRVYNGPLDGKPSTDLLEAVARYREVLGMSREPKISLNFFQEYLRADHRALQSRVEPVVSAQSVAPVKEASAEKTAQGPTTFPVPVVDKGKAGATELSLTVRAEADRAFFKGGDVVRLTVKPSRDAHVYCYLRDETPTIQRFYPNRFLKDSLISTAKGLELPGVQRFQIIANNKGVRETVACFATERDVLADLPESVAGTDFTPLTAESIADIKAAFATVTNNKFAEGYFNVEVR
jgi:hypothetical protein